MADIHDMKAAEDSVSNALNEIRTELQNEEPDDDKLNYYAIQAICDAIIAVGVRLDYVLRDIEHRRTERRADY